VAVLFGLPWRHPFLRTGEDAIRLLEHFDTCEHDEMSAKWGQSEFLLVQIARQP
jgi:hypothetical protein